MKSSKRKTRSDKFPLTRHPTGQRLLGHANLLMATRYVQDVSKQTDKVIENTRKHIIQLIIVTR